MPGYPIRTPWDQRSVDNSPRPIAASHVLHRLLVPRHPPFALSNLTTKMLASTVQFSNNNQTTTHTHHTPQTRACSSLVKGRHLAETTTPHKLVGCSFRTQQDAFTTTPTETRTRSTPVRGNPRTR